MRTHTDIPARLCCGEQHWTVVCPDGRVMCCICFGKYAVDELFTDAAGVTWDVCAECGEQI